jgi:hypothetical protein
MNQVQSSAVVISGNQWILSGEGTVQDIDGIFD